MTCAHPLRGSAAATTSTCRCSTATTSPTMPAPASCTPRPAMAARTSTSGWTTPRDLEARGIDTGHPLHRRRRRLLHQGRAGLRTGREGGLRVIDDKGKKGDANEAVIDGADRGRHAVRARPAEAHLSAFLALQEAGHLPQHAAMVRPHGQGHSTTARRCAARALTAIDDTRFVPARRPEPPARA